MKQNIYDDSRFFEQYKAIRDREFNYNNLLEQPNFKKLVPNLKGRVVLDIGCGMGDFAFYCCTQGAKKVTGIDLSSNMIQAANERYKDQKLIFQTIGLEDLIIEEDTIDFISSSLALHYMDHFGEVIKKISSALKEGGVLLFSIEHPFAMANKGVKDRVYDEEGNLLHFVLDHYHEEGLRTQNWLVDHVMMYHRTFSTIMNTLIEYGLKIERVIEPVPTEEDLQKLPKLIKETRRPSFLIVRAKKCSL